MSFEKLREFVPAELVNRLTRAMDDLGHSEEDFIADVRIYKVINTDKSEPETILQLERNVSGIRRSYDLKDTSWVRDVINDLLENKFTP